MSEAVGVHVHPCWCIRRGLHPLVIRHLHELLEIVSSVWALDMCVLELPQSDLRLRQWISGVMCLHLNLDASILKTEIWPHESKPPQTSPVCTWALRRCVVAFVLSSEPLPVTVRHDHTKVCCTARQGYSSRSQHGPPNPSMHTFSNQVSMRRHECVLEQAVAGPQTACRPTHQLFFFADYSHMQHKMIHLSRNFKSAH